MSSPDEAQVARDLAAYLTKTDGYTRLSPLDGLIRARISTLAGEIATEIVLAHPELRQVIAKQTEDLVRMALRDDAFLRATVASAVGKALGKLVKEESDTDE